MRRLIWKRNSGTSARRRRERPRAAPARLFARNRGPSLGARFRTDPKTTVGSRDRDGRADDARSYPSPCNFPFLGRLGCVALPVSDPSGLITNRSYTGRGVFSGLLARCFPCSSPSLQDRPQTIRVWFTDKDLKAKKSQDGHAAPFLARGNQTFLPHRCAGKGWGRELGVNEAVARPLPRPQRPLNPLLPPKRRAPRAPRSRPGRAAGAGAARSGGGRGAGGAAGRRGAGAGRTPSPPSCSRGGPRPRARSRAA